LRDEKKNKDNSSTWKKEIYQCKDLMWPILLVCIGDHFPEALVSYITPIRD
jgi:hypothetical protein